MLPLIFTMQQIKHTQESPTLMDTYNNSLTELYIRTICRLIVE